MPACAGYWAAGLDMVMFYPEEIPPEPLLRLLAKVFSLLPSDNGTGFNDVEKGLSVWEKVAKYLEAARIAGFIEPDAAGNSIPITHWTEKMPW